MQTGQKIQWLRTRANMTQEHLADRLYVSRELVSKWELGQRKPNIRMIRAIAALFGVDISLLIGDEGVLAELSECIPAHVSLNAIQLKDILISFIDTLSERERSVFIRRYFFLEDAGEIAKAYDIKDNYVRTILARTRKKLKKYMKGALE